MDARREEWPASLASAQCQSIIPVVSRRQAALAEGLRVNRLVPRYGAMVRVMWRDVAALLCNRPAAPSG